MNEKYEAAELLEIGRAQDVILGTKEAPAIDNRAELPLEFRDSPVAFFDE